MDDDDFIVFEDDSTPEFDDQSEEGFSESEKGSETKDPSETETERSSSDGKFEEEFEGLEELGEGQFAKVFKVKSKLDQCYYAVKIIVLSENEDDVKKSLRECQRLAKINHPGVVRYYHSWIERNVDTEKYGLNVNQEEEVTDVETLLDQMKDLSLTNQEEKQTKSCLFILMELCKTSLHDYLRIDDGQTEKDPLKQRLRYLKIFIRILDALTHMHDLGLIHRDIKPDNILQSSEDPDCFKIGDWGFVKGTEEQMDEEENCYSAYSQYFGTLGYIAPEVLKKEVYNSMVDVYSLGVVLIRMMFPSAAEHEIHKIKESIEKEIPCENIWPNLLNDIIFRTLAKDWEMRPQLREIKQTIIQSVKSIEQLIEAEQRFGFYFTELSSGVAAEIVNEAKSLLERNRILNFWGGHGSHKTLTAFKLGHLFRQDGYLTVFFDLTKIHSVIDFKNALLRFFQQPIPNSLEAYNSLIKDCINKCSESHTGLFIILKNGTREYVDYFQEILGAYDNRTKLVLTSQNEIMEQVLHFQGQLPESFLNVSAEKSKILIYLSQIACYSEDDQLFSNILKRLGVESRNKLTYLEELKKSGILRKDHRNNTLYIHWYVKECIEAETDSSELLSIRKIIVDETLTHILSLLQGYNKKNGSANKVHILFQIKNQCHSFFQWIISEKCDEAFSVWKNMSPIIIHHLSWFLNHEHELYDGILEGFLRISLKVGTKNNVTITRAMIADNIRRYGNYDEALKKAEILLGDVSSLQEDIDGLFLKSFMHYLVARTKSEMKVPPPNQTHFLHKQEILKHLQSASHFCIKLPNNLMLINSKRPSKFVETEKSLISSRCYFVYIECNIILRASRVDIQNQKKSLETAKREAVSFLRLGEFILGKHTFIGRYYKDYGDFLFEYECHSEACMMYEKANEIYTKDCDDLERAMLLRNWASSLRYTGDIQKGLTLFDEAQSILNKHYFSENNKYLYKNYSSKASFFYELYIQNGIRCFHIAKNTGLLTEHRFKSQMDSLLGTSVVNSIENNVPEKNLQSSNFKRKLCHYSNNCSRGNECPFAHSPDEKRN